MRWFRGAGRRLALLLGAVAGLASCEDDTLARDLFVGVEGLGTVPYVRARKDTPPEGAPDCAGICMTTVARLTAEAPVASRRSFGGDWHPTPMPLPLPLGLAAGCSVLWPPEARESARRATSEPGSWWAVVPTGRGRVDEQWSLYAPGHGIVGWAKAGPEG
jgi:hypothetical protein